MTTIHTEHTFADLLNLPDDGKLYELVRGQLTPVTRLPAGRYFPRFGQPLAASSPPRLRPRRGKPNNER